MSKTRVSDPLPGFLALSGISAVTTDGLVSMIVRTFTKTNPPWVILGSGFPGAAVRMLFG